MKTFKFLSVVIGLVFILVSGCSNFSKLCLEESYYKYNSSLITECEEFICEENDFSSSGEQTIGDFEVTCNLNVGTIDIGINLSINEACNEFMWANLDFIKCKEGN